MMDRRHFLRGTAAGALGSVIIAPEAVGAACVGDEAMTWEQFAALDFEPWEKDLLTHLPNNEEWQNRIMTIRLAAHILTKTKPEVIKAVEDMEMRLTDDGGESLAVQLIEGIEGTRDFLRGLLAICDQAYARLCCAGLNT